MEERIILAPGANASELLRTLAKNGINTMGWRIVSPVELAKTVLMRAGISVTDDFITRREEPSVIFSFLQEIDYFSAASFADAESLARALYTARGLVTEDEDSAIKERLAKGTFKAKNDAICEVYERYMDWCEDHRRIDSIGLVRKAAEEAADKAREAAARLGGAKYYSLSEYPLTPLEKTLLSRLSGGTFKETDLVSICGFKRNKQPKISFTEAYGHINEAEDIIADIYGSVRPLDSCVIACADPSRYAQIFRDLSCQYGIPLTYGSGVPILNANPARLLKLVYEWKTTGYCGIDGLRDIVMSEAFDRGAFLRALGVTEKLKGRDLEDFAVMAGSLRLSMDDPQGNAKKLKALGETEHRKEIFDMCCAFAAELSKGLEYFITEFSRIREGGAGTDAKAGADSEAGSAGRIDRSALNVITESISAYTANVTDGNADEIIPDLLRKTVSSENSREGCIHVTSIPGALCSIRENLYICGMSADTFPGSPSENYLLLDGDLRLLADGGDAPTSDARINLKKQQFFDLMDFASDAGCRISISYPGYSLSEIKSYNPSSVLFEVFERVHGDSTMEDFSKKLGHVGYFESGIGLDRLVGEKYSSGFGIKADPFKAKLETPENALERAWSPSALEAFMKCPRRFYLERVLGIKVTESDDPFTVLGANVEGDITHAMMEVQGENHYSKEDFLRLSGEAYDRALAARPPMHPTDAAKKKKDFLAMMSKAYDMDPGYEVVSAEEEYVFDHPSGIKLHGYPDRVQKEPGGACRIVDFKSKWKIEHVEDDFSSCLQVIVYAWLCEQAGIKMDGAEYWYTRLGRKVKCRYDDNMKKELGSFLSRVKEAITENDYPRTPGKEACKYCNFADICDWDDGIKKGGSNA